MNKYNLSEMVKKDSKKVLKKVNQEKKQVKGRTETGEKPTPVEIDPVKNDTTGIIH